MLVALREKQAKLQASEYTGKNQGKIQIRRALQQPEKISKICLKKPLKGPLICFFLLEASRTSDTTEATKQQLLYNVVLGSVVQQCESATNIQISSLFFKKNYFQFTLPWSIEQSPLCYTSGSNQLSILYIIMYIQTSQVALVVKDPPIGGK